MTTIELPQSQLIKRQVKTVTKFYSEKGTEYRLKIKLRYDDDCGNGHNSFAITADLDQKGKNGQWYEAAGGCLHDEIEKHAPEMAKYIKWHLCSSDGPMHYVANTVYHASNRDHNGKLKGEKYHIKGHEEKRVVFGDFPISFEFKKEFAGFIESQTVEFWQDAQPVEVPYVERDGNNYKFKPKYSVTNFSCEWYQCPFDRLEEAQDFIKACRIYPPQIKVFQDKYMQVGEGKERDFKAARNSAIWPDATDEELMSEKSELEKLLLARLPKLMEEFKQAMEELGFTY